MAPMEIYRRICKGLGASPGTMMATALLALATAVLLLMQRYLALADSSLYVFVILAMSMAISIMARRDDGA